MHYHGVDCGAERLPGASDPIRFRIRRAEASDAVQLWLLANDREVRQNAFHPEPIPFASHVRWLARKLASPASRIWVGEAGAVIAGQVRYDRVDDHVAEIGVAVSSPFRRRGLGTRLLEETLRDACSELGVTTLRALVRIENEASLRLFKRAGFDCLGRGMVNDRRCYVLERTCGTP